nr:hypothetical protein [Candidatus Desulfatibia profunda]
ISRMSGSNLIAASESPQHARDWRPQVLTFTANPDRLKKLSQFSAWITGKSGLTTVARILEGDGPAMSKQKYEAEAELQAAINSNNLPALGLQCDSFGHPPRRPDIAQARRPDRKAHRYLVVG